MNTKKKYMYTLKKKKNVIESFYFLLNFKTMIKNQLLPQAAFIILTFF